MYTPPVKPAIVPKVVQDLPCATNPSGPQPSKPAPIYQPAAKPPAPAPIPVPVTPPSNAPKLPGIWVPPYNPAPTVASLQNDLSQATLTISAASRALGFTGPASGFIAFAQALAVELKSLRSKK